MSQAQHSGGISRRRFLRGVGGAATAGAIVAAGSSPAAAWDLSWEDAATAATETTVPGVLPGTSYLARKVQDITGGESVEPGSSTPEAVAESWYRTGMYASEHDAWALQVLWNRLEDARTIANVKAKGVAIQAIENGESESFVLNAAKDEIDQYYSLIQINLANHWKVQINKFGTAVSEFQDHSEVSDVSQYVRSSVEFSYQAYGNSQTQSTSDLPTVSSETIQTIDGTSIEVPYFDFSMDHSWTYNSVNPTLSGNAQFRLGSHSSSGTIDEPDAGSEFSYNHMIESEIMFRVNDPDSSANVFSSNLTSEALGGKHPLTAEEASTAIDNGEEFGTWESYNQYRVLWDRIVDEHSQMIANIETWVSNAYGSVQAGDIDVQDLVNNNPTVMASEWSTRYEQTGHLAYAAADLAALGLSFDSERRMRFELDDGTGLEGTLYVSDDEFEINVGEVVQPSGSSANFYAAADTATMERELADDEIRESVDGGEIKLNVGVIRQTEYVVTTTHGETVTIAWDDWAIPEGSDAAVIEDAESVVYDASGHLETAVTSVESILHRYASSEEATVLELTDPFKVTEAYDVETGEQVDVVAGQGYNAGTTDVDLSWIEDYLRMREDTDDYANSGGGGGGGGVNWNGMDWSWIPDFGPSWNGIPIWAIAATGGGILLLAK